MIRSECGTVCFLLKDVFKESSLDILTVITDEASGEALDDKVRNAIESIFNLFMIECLINALIIPGYF